jgi:hypothetical protein
MDSSPKEKLALRELDDNVAWMRIIFQHYLSWYTFFITANLFVLSWVFTKDVKQGTLPLAILFVFLNVCGAVTAALLARYISDANKRNRVLVERVNALAGLEDDEGMRPTFPDALARVGFIFISLGLIGIAGLWIAAGIYF